LRPPPQGLADNGMTPPDRRVREPFAMVIFNRKALKVKHMICEEKLLNFPSEGFNLVQKVLV
jgi:hypothetical protein